MQNLRLLWLFCLLAVAGCQVGTLPDPNDPADVGSLSADNLLGQYDSVSELLQSRVASRQVTQEQSNELLRQASDSLLTGFNPDKADVAKLWRIADVMVSAKHWTDAKPVLEAAVEYAKLKHNEDRRVNDSLSLARVFAEMGNVPEAIKIARSVFNVGPRDGAPILFATLYRVAPAGRGKGHDPELAKLIEDAIEIALHVQVDTTSLPGEQFLMGRRHHIELAWQLVEDLYTDAQKPDLAEKARVKADGMLKKASVGRPVRV